MPRYSFQNNTNLSLNYCYDELLRLIPNLTKQDFGKLINATKQNIGQRMKKDSMLSANELELLKENLKENNLPSKFLDVAILPAESQIVQVPVRDDVMLSCGGGASSNGDFVTDTIGFDINFVEKLGANPKTVSIVYAKGDSMEDKISSGDCLMVDESKTRLNDGMIYAFVYDSELYCKKIQKRPDEITAVSLNKEYEPFKIEQDRPFNIIGQVVGVIKKLS